jgi:transcriptional regulator with XRE-family HTH domain
MHDVGMAQSSDPTSTAVDISMLADLLRKRRNDLSLSLRELSAQIGVPFSTLSRVESGRIPDLNTFRNIVAWLGVPPERFFPTPRVLNESTPEIVEQVIRKDPALTEQARDQLVSVMSQMYAAYTVNIQLAQIHLRSDRAFVPEASELLADLLQEMQEKLLDEKAS